MSVRESVSVGRTGVAALGVALGVVGWWAVVVTLHPPPYVLPSPASVAARLAGNPGLYLQNAAATVEKVLVGGSVGALAGLVLGTLVAHVDLLRDTLVPYLVALRVLPKIAVAPVLLIYFGLGFQTAVLFIALISFFPVTISTAAGFERTPGSHLDLLDSVAAGPFRTFLRVRVPYALPDVFAGLKQAAALAVVGAVVAEWLVSTNGLGYLILISSENIQTSVLLAALVVLLVVGLLVYAGVAAVQWLLLGPLDRYSPPA
jgi:NitT/TauT family transport system permease protein